MVAADIGYYECIMRKIFVVMSLMKKLEDVKIGRTVDVNTAVNSIKAGAE